jgi:hypothetical protein
VIPPKLFRNMGRLRALGLTKGVYMSGLGPWGAQCVGFSMFERTVLKVGTLSRWESWDPTILQVTKKMCLGCAVSKP